MFWQFKNDMSGTILNNSCGKMLQLAEADGLSDDVVHEAIQDDQDDTTTNTQETTDTNTQEQPTNSISDST